MNDVRARNSDRPHHGDFADSLIDGNRHKRRDEQKADEQTHRSKHYRELPEITKPLVHLVERRLGRDYIAVHVRLNPSHRRVDVRSLDERES